MKKAALPHDKYYLRTLHQEIDLYDRKLAYLDQFEVFETQAARDDAEKRMQTKRATLAKNARELAAAGVEFNETELPRSFRVSDPQESPTTA